VLESLFWLLKPVILFTAKKQHIEIRAYIYSKWLCYAHCEYLGHEAHPLQDLAVPSRTRDCPSSRLADPTRWVWRCCRSLWQPTRCSRKPRLWWQLVRWKALPMCRLLRIAPPRSVNLANCIYIWWNVLFPRDLQDKPKKEWNYGNNNRAVYDFRNNITRLFVLCISIQRWPTAVYRRNWAPDRGMRLDKQVLCSDRHVTASETRFFYTTYPARPQDILLSILEHPV